MNTLSTEDYELMLACIRELHSFRDPLLLRNWLLDVAFPRILTSDWISYNEVDLLSPENSMAVIKPDMAPALLPLFPRFKELAYQHPLITRQIELDNFPVHKISDFVSQKDYHRLELYHEVYRLLGVEYQIAITIRLQPNHVTAFAFSRRLKDFDERDRLILELLRPHLVVAFNNLALAGESRKFMKDQFLALDQLSSATIVINDQGRILYHTGRGLSWLGLARPVACIASPEILPARIFDWVKTQSPDSPPQILSLASDVGEIHIRAAPASTSNRTLLVLTLKNDPTQLIPEKYDLTHRQTEVAQWVCEGKTNVEIATILGISPRTVQKHIEHIYEKLGVESRVALTLHMRGKI
jgi:DNA-binding CsgD family transcriptional regulator